MRDEPWVTSVGAWRPARQYPETYPGDCPPTSYFILNENVYPVAVTATGDLLIEPFGDASEAVDSVLSKLELPSVEDRYVVVAYGANRNPATLSIKLLNYGYRSPNGVIAVPALRGRMSSTDVVACGLHGQGYLYGDLLIGSGLTKATSTEAWLLLLDHDQLRVLHDSEGVSTGLYTVAVLPDTHVDGFSRSISPLVYVANTRMLISPQYDRPLAFSSVAAEGRGIPEMTAGQMIQHTLQVFSLRSSVSRMTGIVDDENLPGQLMKYLNGQWWYHFNTAQAPLEGYDGVLRLFEEHIGRSSTRLSTADHMRRQGLALSPDGSYAPGRSFTWGRLTAHGT
jgi:hypothetical protein